MPGTGILFIGDKGKMIAESSGGTVRLLPYEATGRYKKPAE